MSTYQYYEFQAIDRLLTEEEQQAVARLSSRVDPHPSRAVFVYHWSDLPGDPADILARYYDAMVYMASWGSRQLMFRFPRTVLDLEAAGAYCQPLIVQDYLSFSVQGPHAILSVEFHYEERYSEIEGEGWLPPMLPLRDAILQGDYRALYLAWLKVMEEEDLLESVLEPPVPPGLRERSPALQRLVEFLDIDEVLVQVAAEASRDRQGPPEGWLQRALARLPGEERDAFLLRLAQGEPQLAAALNRRLGELLPVPEQVRPPRRTVGQLRQETRARREQERRRRAAEAEAKRTRDLEDLARREREVWVEVFGLIERKQGNAYDEAVKLLVRLRELATHRGSETAFQERLNGIYEAYSRRPGLIRRLQEAGLYAS